MFNSIKARQAKRGTFTNLVAAGAAFLLLAAAPVASFAQETSSDVRVTVTDASGAPVASAEIVVRNELSGLTRSTTTDANGVASVRNLPIGTSYSVVATSEGFAGQRTSDVAINLGQTATVTFVLQSGAAIEEVVAIGQAQAVAQTAIGPSATFSLDDLQSLPAINRNITDVIRADARIFVDESRGDINAVQCVGKNPRFNSLTVDGIRLNDGFGLNSNGFPTERMPFSFDAISQVAVEIAPFDVQYGGFSACNINAVTKSGGNEISGSAFYDYTDDGLRGDTLEGDDIVTGDFSEKRYGINFGGPIIKDKLFFFAAYEKLEGANLFDRGAIGSGAVNEIPVTQAELDEIADIARTLYQYDPGPIPTSLPNEDEKLLVKFDWNINDLHRATFTYNYNDGNNFTQSDGDNDEFEFQNHLYERGAEQNAFAATLYSDWSDVFSTEVRFAYSELDNRQISVGGTDFGEIRVELDDVDVYLGGDDSRQANDLEYDISNIILRGNYQLGDHSISFGYERDELDVFNLFVQHTETEIRFDGIEDFRNGLADAIYYNNAPSNNPTDAAAVWGYATNTLYIQDEFLIGDSLTVVAGLRYDFYETDDAPGENTDFVQDYGFSNSTNLDGEGLIQPRFGFTYDLNADVTIRGGIGRYSGGNPNVWLSNNFSSNNVLQFGQRGRSFCYTGSDSRSTIDCGDPFVQVSLFDPGIQWAGCEDGVPVGPGYCVPPELFNAVANGVGDNFELNYLDPDFEIPSEWKFALGLTMVLPTELVFSADVLVTRGENTAIVKRGDIDRVGFTGDGYPIYESNREASFVLTNTESVDNESFSLSLGLAKTFDNGFDFQLGYAYSDAEDVNPMTSSVAFSNYQNRAFFDPQEEVLSTSNYNIEHRFTGSLRWRKQVFTDSELTVALFGQANSGRPFSIAFDGTIDPYNFTPFLDFRDNVLLPGAERNDQNGTWWRKIDMRASLDFPGFSEGHRAEAFIVIDNLSNLIDDSAGVLYQHNFPRTVTVNQQESRIGDASRYEIRFGLQYDF
ncbi:MAG: TonB-dependent receptor [Pseudomonadota bacterium]